MLRRSALVGLLLAASGCSAFVPHFGISSSSRATRLSMKEQGPQGGGRQPGQQQQRQQQQADGAALLRALGRSLALGGVAVSPFLGGLGPVNAVGGAWSYDKQTVQKQVARVEKAEQKELRDEVKDPANVIAKVRMYGCWCGSRAGA